MDDSPPGSNEPNGQTTTMSTSSLRDVQDDAWHLIASDIIKEVPSSARSGSRSLRKDPPAQSPLSDSTRSASMPKSERPPTRSREGNGDVQDPQWGLRTTTSVARMGAHTEVSDKAGLFSVINTPTLSSLEHGSRRQADSTPPICEHDPPTAHTPAQSEVSDDLYDFQSALCSPQRDPSPVVKHLIGSTEDNEKGNAGNPFNIGDHEGLSGDTTKRSLPVFDSYRSEFNRCTQSVFDRKVAGKHVNPDDKYARHSTTSMGIPEYLGWEVPREDPLRSPVIL